MNWIIADLLMFVFSVILYLLVRKALLDKLPPQFNILASFSIPLVVFLVAAVATGASFAISPINAMLMIFSGIFFSYFPNVFLLKSIEQAPNPGYSLVVAKSYVVLTTLLAVPLFGAKLSFGALFAILLIIGFSALIMIVPKAARYAKCHAWLPFALGAFFGWGLLMLVAKYLFSQGMPSIVFLSYLALVVVPCILLEMRVKKMSFAPIKKHLSSFLLIGIGSALYNFFNFYAISVAPNVGYVNATSAASIAVVTIFATLLFGDEFSWRKIIGVFGVVGGLFLLFLAS